MYSSIRVIYNPNAQEEFKYTVIPSSAKLKAAIDAIRNLRSCDQLTEYAILRHGYGNTDSMSGVVYPTDLDEFDRLTEYIPEHNVKVYAWYGESTGPDYVIPENQYLSLLREYLLLHREHDHAIRIESLLRQTEH
ncbi:hypothetical protein [Leptospira adleri]|nr:hypothetical protein [Leptospira adleri]